MRKIFLLLAVASSVVLSTVLLAQPANASGGYSPVVNNGSGLCLQPVPDSYAGHIVSIYDNNIPIEQLPCNGSAEQLWTTVASGTAQNPTCTGWGCPVDPGYVDYLVNGLTGKCMDVTNASTANGAVIQQYACNGGGSEKWWHRNSASGSWDTYLDYRTKKCLDVPGGSFGQIVLQQYTCNNSAAQYFTLP